MSTFKPKALSWPFLAALLGALTFGFALTPAHAQTDPYLQYGNPMLFSDQHNGPRKPADDLTLLGENIGEIQFRIFRSTQSNDASPLFKLQGHKTLLMVLPSKSGSGLEFIGSGRRKTVGEGTFTRNKAHRLLFRLVRDVGQETGLTSEKWEIMIDGTAVGEIADSEFIPDDGERLSFALGSKFFRGTIDQFAIRTPTRLLYVHNNTQSGLMVRRSLPYLGAYLEVGSEPGVKKTDLGPKISPAHHGIFDKAVYFGLAATSSGTAESAGIAVVADWGGVLELMPDMSDPNRYVPRHNADKWAGDLTFDSDERTRGRKVRFTANGSKATGARPFLKDGRRYELAPERPKSKSIKSTTFDSTTGIPNFWFSVMACYNVTTMDLSNFQNAGCSNRPIFAFPGNGEFRNTGVLRNVPYGWDYIPFATEEASSRSTLATTSKELNVAYTGSESSEFTALGYTTSTNTQTEREHGNLSASERMQKISQSFATSSHMVLKPSEVRLDQCLIHSVLRAAATAKATTLGVRLSELAPDGWPTGPEYYDPIEAEENCEGAKDDALDPGRLIGNYGTHYAHAITYGARAITKTSIHKNVLRELVSNKTNLTTSRGFEIAVDIGAKGVKLPEKIGSTKESSSGNGRSSSIETTDERVYRDTFCFGGSSCSEDSITIGDQPAPVYLDLRRFDQLLAPPFFEDIAVLQTLRPLVAKELDRILEQKPVNEMPPVLRIVDWELAKDSCYFNPNSRDASGEFFSGFAWVQDLCELLGSNAVVEALSTTTSGVSKKLTFEVIENAFFPNKDWQGPPLQSKMFQQCNADGKCLKRRFRMIIEPDFERVGNDARLAPSQKVGIKLFPLHPRTQNIPKTIACSDSCAIPFAAFTDEEDGYPYVVWADDLLGPRSLKLIPNFIGFSKTQPVPKKISGEAAAFFDGPVKSGKWFGYSLEFNLYEEDLPGALGFAKTLPNIHEPANLSLASVAPASAQVAPVPSTPQPGSGSLAQFVHVGQFYSNDDYLYDDANKMKTRSLANCAALCLRTFGCGAFTYAYKSVCTLFPPQPKWLGAKADYQAYERTDGAALGLGVVD